MYAMLPEYRKRLRAIFGIEQEEDDIRLASRLRN